MAKEAINHYISADLKGNAALLTEGVQGEVMHSPLCAPPPELPLLLGKYIPHCASGPDQSRDLSAEDAASGGRPGSVALGPRAAEDGGRRARWQPAEDGEGPPQRESALSAAATESGPSTPQGHPPHRLPAHQLPTLTGNMFFLLCPPGVPPCPASTHCSMVLSHPTLWSLASPRGGWGCAGRLVTPQPVCLFTRPRPILL